eukprot:4822904-Prymnesium_polylepis.1
MHAVCVAHDRGADVAWHASMTGRGAHARGFLRSWSVAGGWEVEGGGSVRHPITGRPLVRCVVIIVPSVSTVQSVRAAVSCVLPVGYGCKSRVRVAGKSVEPLVPRAFDQFRSYLRCISVGDISVKLNLTLLNAGSRSTSSLR